MALPGKPENAFWLAPTLLAQEIEAEVIVAAMELNRTELLDNLVADRELQVTGEGHRQGSSCRIPRTFSTVR